jgi:hypothetical protein
VKVELVKQNFLKEWRNGADVRRLVRRFGRYELTDRPARQSLFGVNSLDLKEIYVEQSRVSSSGWGEEYGRSLAQGENEMVLNKLIASLPALGKSPVAGRAIITAASDAVSRLVRDEYEPILLALSSWFVPQLFEQSSEFSRSTEFTRPRMLGHFKGKPVFSLRYSGRPMLLVTDLHKVGLWRQFTPRRHFDEEMYLEEGISFMVRPYDEATARELLQKQPKFRQDSEGRPRPEGEAIRELLQRVHVRILEQFTFEITDKLAGYKISIARER